MIAKIIKLDDYLNEYIDMHQPSVVIGISNALNVSEDIAKELYSHITRQQEVDLVTTFMKDTLNDDQKIAVAHSIFDPIIATMNEPQLFSGVDIAEGFNFHREVENEVARNNIMDWLEENSIEYLIDNIGNFAVKCNDRKAHYRVNRQFEKAINKWDNGPVGRNVDPTVHRKALTVDMKGNLLSDALNEAPQDGSMPLPDMTGTPPMFPAKGEDSAIDGSPTVFENSEEGAIQILGDYINNSSDVYVEKLDEETTEWLVCDDFVERSFVVNILKGNFEEVQYIYESGGGPTRGFGHSPGILGARPDDPRGDRHDLPTTFDSSGVEVAYDPVMKRTVERFSDMIQNVDLDTLIDATRSEKIAFMTEHGAFSPQELKDPMAISGALKRYDRVIGYMSDIKTRGGDAGLKESKTAKQREKAARDKMDNMIPGQGMAKAIAHGTHKKKSGAHDDKKRYSRKEKHKDAMSEGVLGGMTGMTGVQTLGSINRLRTLAGLPDSTMIVIEEEPIKNESIVTIDREIHDIDEALDYLNEVFHIYKTLNTTDKTELRLNLINAIMNDSAHLSESVIDLLLDNKPSVLLEFDGEGEQLSNKDKKYLNMVISDIKITIMEDIENSETSIVVPLARIAFLLEALQIQMEEK